YRSDCFDEVPLDRYDLIISNPPYEPTALMKTLPPEFKKEPRMALDGGTDGMDIIKKIIGQAGARLNPKGVLLLEIGALHSAVETEYGHLDPVWLPTDDASNSICLFQAEQLIAETKRTGSGAKPSNRIRK
ncbi:MAG TPA: hypothetical protein VKC60_15400, partial [Opitutaceae bacterium]|nr:hypothetical protein [Opitutaceae bacterium]